jgi:hypothetical protein
MMEDTFCIFVSHTSGEGAFRETPQITLMTVQARTTNDATLTALEMVAARGRCPVACEIDWDNF